MFSSTTLNIAHRGARSLAPENTLAAARKAYQIGTDLWELDVTLTSDGVPILLHDDTLVRTSDAAEIFPNRHPWTASGFTLAEFRRLDFGSWFIRKDPFKQIASKAIPETEWKLFEGEPAPTLREALEFTREHNWSVNVEIKNLQDNILGEALVRKVVTQIRDLNMIDQVLISSFNHGYLKYCKETQPRLSTAALVEFFHPTPVKLLRRLGARAYNPSLSGAFPWLIQHIRSSGYDVNVYTVNREEDMKHLIAAGVSGIFTDFPQLLKPILERG